MNEEIKDYLRSNLSVEIKKEHDWVGKYHVVELRLEDEVISSSTILTEYFDED